MKKNEGEKNVGKDLMQIDYHYSMQKLSFINNLLHEWKDGQKE